MSHRLLAETSRAVIVTLLVTSVASCSSEPPPTASTVVPTKPSLEFGPVVDVYLTTVAWTMPGYHRTDKMGCYGSDNQGYPVDTRRKRTWSSSNPSILTVTPVITSQDSGSTATVTGGANTGHVWVRCTISGLNGSSKTDSTGMNNESLMTATITPDVNNPITIPPGQARVFTFNLVNNFGGGLPGNLSFTSTGNVTIDSPTSRTVTAHAFGDPGQLVTITAHSPTFTVPGLLDGSNQPYLFTAPSATDTAVVAYDPLYVSMIGDQTICSPGTYQWQANATGGTQSFSYQWSVYWYNTGTTLQLGTGQTQSLTINGQEGDFVLTATVTAGSINSAFVDVRNNAISGDC